MNHLNSTPPPRLTRVLDFVLQWETVFDRNGTPVAENDPDDPGGLTKFGIDQRSHPGTDIRNLTRALATDIYRRDYWQKIRGDELPVPLGEVLFDIAVNNGRARGIKWLQEELGVEVDGVIGPITLDAIRKAKPESLAKALLARREGFYRAIATGGKAKFLKGWLNRNHALGAFIEGLEAE